MVHGRNKPSPPVVLGAGAGDVSGPEDPYVPGGIRIYDENGKAAVGHTSTAGTFSSATVDGRTPGASRICLRWYSAVRPTNVYFAKSAAWTFTHDPRTP